MRHDLTITASELEALKSTGSLEVGEVYMVDVVAYQANA
jgi:hypothetical protein